MLRRRPRGRLRMTRGRCGSLVLQRMKLSFTTPRRFDRRTRSTTMKPSTSIFGQAATALLAGALLLGTAITAKAQSEQSPNGLEGTWRVQVTQYNCATGATLPPFWSLLSFARGGVLTETTTSPGFLPGQRTPGHGVWI